MKGMARPGRSPSYQPAGPRLRSRPPARPPTGHNPGPSAPAAGDAGMFGPHGSFGRFSLVAVAAILGALTQPRSLAHAAVTVPGREPVQTVYFERHVMGLFSKAGCNN